MAIKVNYGKITGKLENPIIKLTQEDFKGSDLENHNFNIEIHSITRSSRKQLIENARDENGEFNDAKYDLNNFVDRISLLDGLFEDEFGTNVDADPRKLIPIYEDLEYSEPVNAIIKKISEIDGVLEKQEEDLKKNVSEDSSTELNTVENVEAV